MPRRPPRSGSKVPSTAEAVRAQSVLLEQLGSQIATVLEAVTSSRTELQSQMAALEQRLSDRITVLEEVVRENSAGIRRNSEDIRKNSEDIRKNSEDILTNTADLRALRDEVTGLRHDFEHREERGRLGPLESRVAAVEARLGIGPR